MRSPLSDLKDSTWYPARRTAFEEQRLKKKQITDGLQRRDRIRDLIMRGTANACYISAIMRIPKTSRRTFLGGTAGAAPGELASRVPVPLLGAR